MSETTKKIASVAGSAVLLTGLAAAPIATMAQDATASEQPEAAVIHTCEMEPQMVQNLAVHGTFTFTQTALTPVGDIARVMNDGAKYLCGSTFTGTEAAAAGEWPITVGGAVENGFSATLQELEENGRFEVVMGCSCAGNPGDGSASVNAEVTGITVNSIMEAAAVERGANTVVFTSRDGYEVALPLTYVAQRPSLIVFAVNGEDIADSIGGSNQLWLGSTSAKYFVRNVSDISFEVRDEAPPIPGTEAAGDTYANVPNIGIAYGGAA